MNKSWINQLIQTIALLALLGLAACGGGGGGGGGSATGSATPSQVALVDVSTAGSTSIDVSWFPVTDSVTPASAMKYQVHASTNPAYTPGSATLKTEVTGNSSAHLTGLQASTSYTIMVVAVDASGNSSTSFPSTVTTSALDNQTIPGVVVTTPTAIQITAVSGDQVTLAAGAIAPEAGQFIVSTNGDGFLRQVTSVSTVDGQTVVQTQLASLNQVASVVEISSVFSLVSVPAGATQAGIVVNPSSSPSGATEWQWPQTNFRLSSAPVKRVADKAQGALQTGVVSGSGNIDVSTKQVSKVGSWSTFTGPDTVGILTGTSGAVNLNVNLTNIATDWSGNSIPLTICKVTITSDGGAPGLFSIGSMAPAGSGNITQGITVNAAGITARAEPYVVKLRAYVDEAHNNCTEDYRLLMGWKEKLDIAINVVVVSTPNFPKSESKALDFTGSFTVHNDVTFTFDPKLEAEVKLNNTQLNYARLETKSRAELAQKLTVSATGTGTLDKTQTLITPRTFVKVYMVGAVPVVMSGEFSADLRVQGNVTGALTATEEIKFSLEDMNYGVIYENNAWRTTQNVRPTYELKLAGNGDAEAHLTLTLLPKLSVKFYDAATGRLIVAPYLQADAGVHGQVLADITPAGTTTDADYWLTQGKISGGVDAYLMADFTILDYTLAKWPSTANIADYTTFSKVTLRENTPIAGLPSLTGTVDYTTINPSDIKAFLIKGREVDVANPFQGLFGGPVSFLPWDKWTQTKVIAPNNTGYTFVAAPAGSDPGDVWVKFANPGAYTVRLGGNSAMGAWARQVKEVEVVLTDNNSDGIIDQLEPRLPAISPANPQVILGLTVQLTANDPQGNPWTIPNLQWLSSNTSVATVSSTGLVTAIAVGTADITVTDPVSLASKSTTVTVSGLTLTITPENPSVSVGATVLFNATATDAQGNPIAVSGNLEWISSSPAVATVNAIGQVTGVSPGTSSIGVRDTVSGAIAATAVTVAPTGYIVQGGLTWMPITFYDTWANANTYCASFNGLGQSGWRLPTQVELSALYTAYPNYSPELRAQGWTLYNTWSSTPDSTGSHYSVYLYYGFVFWNIDTNFNYVTCVR